MVLHLVAPQCAKKLLCLSSWSIGQNLRTHIKKNPPLFCLFVLLLFLFCNARFVLFCIVSFFSYARLKMLIETAQYKI